MRTLAVMVMLAGPAMAAGYPDGIPGDEVAQLIRAALAEAGQEAGDLAVPGRSFPACETVPQVAPRQGSWATAEVSCPAPVWSRAVRTGLAIPQRAVAEPEAAGSTGPMVVTLARSVARGAVLTAADVTLAPVAARAPDGIFTDPTDVIGRRTKAAMGEGKAVLLRQLEPDWLVEAGNPLVLIAAAGGLAVSAPAEALEDGAMGDVIRVVNLSSQREVKAIVTGRNSVTVQTNMR